VLQARARARANIALAKYWGKNDVALNLPAVPSLSMTLDRLVTETTVRFDPALRADRFRLDGRDAGPRELRRVTEMLDRVRVAAGLDRAAFVTSENRFPTAAGLASSASGFAALAAAATAAAGLDWKPAALSRLARRSSASAGRSIFGGYVELPAGRPGDDRCAARQIAPEDHWDLRLVVAVTVRGPKKVGSTEGMERSRKTSPLYDAWVAKAPGLCLTIRRALLAKDIEKLGQAMEQSTFAFHACAMTSAPGIVYFQPATLAALGTVHALRDAGVPVFATMDAGPHVKALCLARDAARVRRALARTEGVLDTLVARAGAGIEVG
jgi:diphosphomevalonate decarboxylase